MFCNSEVLCCWCTCSKPAMYHVLGKISYRMYWTSLLFMARNTLNWMANGCWSKPPWCLGMVSWMRWPRKNTRLKQKRSKPETSVSINNTVERTDVAEIPHTREMEQWLHCGTCQPPNIKNKSTYLILSVSTRPHFEKSFSNSESLASAVNPPM